MQGFEDIKRMAEVLSKELRLKEERNEMSRREWRIDRSRERW